MDKQQSRGGKMPGGRKQSGGYSNKPADAYLKHGGDANGKAGKRIRDNASKPLANKTDRGEGGRRSRKVSARRNVAQVAVPMPEQYCRDVLDGKIVACKWVRLACERHLRDLEHGHERGLVFDAKAGARAIKFFDFLKHSKGQWADKPVTLESWQQFILWCVFGWKRANGMRRFRTVYAEVARKNGKTTMLAGIGLYMLIADGEAGAEVYSAATKRDQAKIMWVEAARMARKSSGLVKILDIFGDKNPKATACSISVSSTASKYEPLGRDADSMDGLNVHCALIDELHAHKTRDMVDILDTATGARRQPLILMITTAGFNRQTICYEINDYTKKVLSDLVEDDSFFGMIFTLDDDDDWEDETNWVKANPNLGVSKRMDDMRDKATKAKAMPTALNAFLRLELNIWTQAETRWINLEHWDACNKPFDIETLRGRECYGGLDLSSTLDTTALVLVFPPTKPDDDYVALSYFWVPDDNIIKRAKQDRFPYDLWEKRGLIEATPGEVVDYDFIQAKIEELARVYNIREIAFDRWNATSLINRLAERHVTKLIEFGQGYAGMSPAAKLFESKYVSHQLNHLGNPVLSWMAGNVVVTSDPAGNIKPDKDKSIERIDGITALLMALDRATRPGISVYEDRGILVL